jgi:hypothetical protein
VLVVGQGKRFRGAIAGVGTTSGVRVVVGRWTESPYGPFSDAMVETSAGHRVLLAPGADVAEFVAATYVFDEVRVEPVAVEGVETWSVRTPSLELDIVVGRRTVLGLALRLVPARLAESPRWSLVTDPVARLVARGVRTRGSAGGGRREWYGATDHHAVVTVGGSFDGADVGALAPVLPAPRFGFSSTPRWASVTTVVTTVEDSSAA